MRKTIHAAAVFAAALAASLILAGCPLQPAYSPTITPIYAATSGNGLYVYDGTSWTNYPTTSTGNGLTGVVVFGSGTGATVLAGGASGVAQFDGSTWTTLNSGLGTVPVHHLTLSSTLCASTDGGLSILNPDGSWTNNGSVKPVNDAILVGTFTLVAGGGTLGAPGLYIYSGTVQSGSAVAPTTIGPGGSTSVTSVFVDVFGELIAGTDAGFGIQSAGIQSAGTAPWTTFASASVNSVYADPSGIIYAATASGLYIVVNMTATQVLAGQNVHCVTVDGAGTIYAGTTTGLMVSRNGGSTWTTEKLTPSSVTSVATTAPLYSF
jgi:hypothetical protein